MLMLHCFHGEVGGGGGGGGSGGGGSEWEQ